MKHYLILIVCLIICSIAYAQAPQSFQYQAVVRDVNGNALTNQSVSFQLSIISGVLPGNVEYVETHTATTNAFGVVTLAVGSGIPITNLFSDIDWSISPCYLKVEADLGTGLINMGTTQLLSVPYAMYAQNAGNAGDTLWNLNGNNIYNKNSRNVGIGINAPPGKLVVQGDSLANATDPLFEVKDKDGNSVFVVYQDSVHVYVKKGNGTKSNQGGFAVSGRSNSKSSVNDYLLVTPDSVRIYIEDNDMLTSNRGGFAVSGRSNSKGIEKNYLNVSVDTSETIDPPQNRILWYPSKSAFLTGNVLIESPDSVGTNSFATGYESKAIGNQSQALGFRAIARGLYSTAIGKNAIANDTNTFAFGDGAKALNNDSYSFGALTEAKGIGSFAFGYVGRDSLGPTGIITRATGNYSFAFGLGSQALAEGSIAFGINDSAIAPFSMALGYKTKASGWYSLSMGYYSTSSGKASTASGYSSKASGDYSTAIGYYSMATNTGTTAFGFSSNASGPFSTAIGKITTASGNSSTAMGFGASAIGSNSFSLGYYSTASGNISVAMGDQTSAVGSTSFAMGQQSSATGNYSTALGYHTTSGGSNSTALGTSSVANGYASIAMGHTTTAVSIATTAMGYQTVAYGGYSTAAGYNTKAKSYDSFVIGRYNDTTCISAAVWNAADPLFIIGNGSATNSRSNAMNVLKNGETYLPFVYNATVGATNRDLYIDNTGKLGYVSSSLRYKKNIVNMENVDWLYQLRPVNYSYKNDNKNRKEYGLIAEEVEKINPLFVSYNNDGTVETVNYSSFIAPLLKALQSQQIEIELLKNKVVEYDNLKAEIEKIKKYQSDNK